MNGSTALPEIIGASASGNLKGLGDLRRATVRVIGEVKTANALLNEVKYLGTLMGSPRIEDVIAIKPRAEDANPKSPNQGFTINPESIGRFPNPD